MIGLGDKFSSPNALNLHSQNFKGKRILCPFSSELKSGKIGKVYYKTYSRYLIDTDSYMYIISKCVTLFIFYFLSYFLNVFCAIKFLTHNTFKGNRIELILMKTLWRRQTVL